MKKSTTTLSLRRRLITAIIAALPFSHGFVFGTQHNTNNYSPRGGITPSSSLAETQRDKEDAAVDDSHRRTLLLLTSLYSCCCQPAISYAANNNNDGNIATPSLPSDMIFSPRRIQGIHDPNLQNYVNPLLPNWKGTALPGPLSLSEAYSQFILPSLSSTTDDYYNTAVVKKTATTVFPMGKWPDPILRIPSSQIPLSTFHNKSQLQMLQSIADTLRNTARKEGAVGLAAQQCGIDASLIFVDGVVLADTAASSSSSSSASDASAIGGIFGQNNWRNSKKQVTGEGSVLPVDNHSLLPTTRRIGKEQPPKSQQGIFLVNPRIIHRSPESEMLVWTEECLVLPPEFRATLLRDAEITIEYETLTTKTTAAAGSSGTEECSSCGETKQITLRGELARCAQHEMDHDRGVLIVDHVGLEELLSINGQSVMEDVENSDGRHAERMQHAYARDVVDSVLLPSVKTHRNVDLAFGNRDDFLARKVDCFVECDLDRTASSSSHPWFVPPANALESDNNRNDSASSSRSSSNEPNTRSDNPDNGTSTISSCDDACLGDRKRRIQERRAMMQQSRSATNRGDVLELSRQRALMYGTSYEGLSPGTCAQPGFCP
jgi:peptide deformylase